MTEKTQVTDRLVKELNKLPNVLVWKRFSGRFGNKGYPDITGVVKVAKNSFELGIRIEIECKLPGKEPTKIQASYLKKFGDLGCICFWTDDWALGLEEFTSQLTTIKNNI